MEYSKAKSSSKIVITKSDDLEKIVLSTMKKVNDIVSATLGPGGSAILIERSETLAPMISKDGVTVFKSLGLNNSVAHVIMEAARDASQKTGNSAGDGTTTACVLSEAIVRRSSEFCKQHPKVPPQIVVRTLEKAFREVIEPTI